MGRYWSGGGGGKKPVAGLARTAQRAVPNIFRGLLSRSSSGSKGHRAAMSALVVRYWSDGGGGEKPVAGLARTAQRAVPTLGIGSKNKMSPPDLAVGRGQIGGWEFATLSFPYRHWALTLAGVAGFPTPFSTASGVIGLVAGPSRVLRPLDFE